jgi:hypothetical protein
MSRYNLRSHVSSQKPTTKRQQGEPLFHKIIEKTSPAQPPVPIPAHLLPPVEEDPEIRPPEVNEDSEPHLGTTAVNHMVDPACPPDDEGLVPPLSIRPDDLETNIDKKDHGKKFPSI